jgi:proteasome lid subunit RPN8/RPN11
LADLDPAVEQLDGPAQASPPAAHFFFARKEFGMTVDVVRVDSADTPTQVCTLRWDVGHPAGTADAVAVGAAAAGLLLDDVFELDPLPLSLCWDWTDPFLPRLARTPQSVRPQGIVRVDAALQCELLADSEAMRVLEDECLTRAPAEACGLLVRNGAGRLEVVPTRNLQDDRHLADPDCYPRTSRTAWQLDTRAVARQAEQGRSLVAFWHSHVDTDARFSAEDLTGAAPNGQPLYPGVAQVVVAVSAGKCSEVKAYRLGD